MTRDLKISSKSLKMTWWTSYDDEENLEKMDNQGHEYRFKDGQLQHFSSLRFFLLYTFGLQFQNVTKSSQKNMMALYLAHAKISSYVIYKCNVIQPYKFISPFAFFITQRSNPKPSSRTQFKLSYDMFCQKGIWYEIHPGWLIQVT